MPTQSRQDLLARFGACVREKRRAMQLSQEELGFRAGLDRTYISGIERGRRNPTLTAIALIAHALDTTVAALIQELEDPFEHGG